MPKDTTYTVADTSVYIEHADKLRDLDFTALLDGWPDKPVVVIVPLIIFDELDGRISRSVTRGVPRKAAADGTCGTVYMDMLFDPPRHERLPINDDETSTGRCPRKASRMPPSLC